jgi:hypothetical protein
MQEIERVIGWLKAFTAALDRSIWGSLVPDKDGRVSETERALSTVRGFATLGLVAVALFGWMASPKDGSLRGAATALLAAMAAFGAGGLMGFFFGLPRWSADSAPPRKPGGAADTDAAQESRGSVVHNTNLHRVIEWLTTLIVGLGLVHLKEAIQHATTTSRWLTGEIVAPKDPMSVESGTPGAAILLTYAIAGFFLVFLWTVRYMGREILNADNEMQRMEKVLAQTKTQMNSIIAAQAAGSTAPPTPAAPPAAPAQAPAAAGPAAPRQAIAAFAPPQPPVAAYQPEAIGGLAARNISQEIVTDLNQRYLKSSSYQYEPLEGFGSRDDVATARRLEASVVEVGPGLAIFEVTLRVVSTAAQARPLVAEVIFLLHHTLPPVARVVQPHNGVAELKVQCIGSFVAGAVIAGEPTRLSFDLSALPNATRDFIEG